MFDRRPENIHFPHVDNNSKCCVQDRLWMLRCYYSWIAKTDVSDQIYVGLQKVWVTQRIQWLTDKLDISQVDVHQLRQCIIDTPIENLDKIFIDNKYYNYYKEKNFIQ